MYFAKGVNLFDAVSGFLFLFHCFINRIDEPHVCGAFARVCERRLAGADRRAERLKLALVAGDSRHANAPNSGSESMNYQVNILNF